MRSRLNNGILASSWRSIVPLVIFVLSAAVLQRFHRPLVEQLNMYLRFSRLCSGFFLLTLCYFAVSYKNLFSTLGCYASSYILVECRLLGHCGQSGLRRSWTATIQFIRAMDPIWSYMQVMYVFVASLKHFCRKAPEGLVHETIQCLSRRWNLQNVAVMIDFIEPYHDRFDICIFNVASLV